MFEDKTDVASKMTYREWLIGMAMQGMIAAGGLTLEEGSTTLYTPTEVIEMADGVLAAMAKKEA